MTIRIKKVVALFLCLIMSLVSQAKDVEFRIGRLYYKVISESEKTCEVSGIFVQGGVDIPGPTDVVKPEEKEEEKLNIDIPAEVTHDDNTYIVIGIGRSALAKQSSIVSLVIPNTVTYIADFAFSGCSSVESIVVPESVTSLGDFAFSNCKSLQTIQLPENLKEIGSSAFSNCLYLKSITVPDKITVIRSSTFNGCSSLANVAMPNGITKIEDNAFLNCTSLRSISIPYKTKNIGTSVFSGCTRLENVNMAVNVRNIGNNAFGNCKSLKSIVLPTELKIIGYNSFQGCSSLYDIINLSSVPLNVSEQAFATYDANLHVRSGYEDVYANAVVWKNFSIVGDAQDDFETDITNFDNIIYFPKASVRVGDCVEIPICMKNNMEVCNFSFSMSVPEGVTIESVILSEERTQPKYHNIFDVVDTEGGCSVKCESSLQKSFNGKDGEVVIAKLKIADDLPDGDYKICLNDIAMESTTKTMFVEYSNCFISVTSPESADANGDGKINGGDITAIVNYLLGYKNSKFYPKAADANGDGKINGGDITAVVNLLLYGSVTGEKE